MKTFLIILSILVLSCNNDWGESKCPYTVNEELIRSTRDTTYQLCDNGYDTVGVWIWYSDKYRLYTKDSVLIDSLTHN
jgi:hypothetical protein